jgi:hypothetical protein
MALQSQCPNCSKVLNLKSKAALGKRVPCPKCKRPFVVEPYEEEEYYDEDDGYEEDGYEDDGYEDDYQDDGYEDDYDEAPRRSKGGRQGGGRGGDRESRGGKGGAKKSRRKQGGMPAWAKGLLAGGGGILVLALLIWGVMSLLGGGSGGGSGKFNFAYLPSRSNVVVAIKPAEIWNSKLLQPIRNHQMVAMGLAELRKQVDFDIDDVESIVMAFPDLKVGQANDPEMLTVGHLKKELVIPTTGIKEVEHNGTKFFDIGGGRALWQPKPTVVVIGNKSLVTAAIDQGETDNGDTSRFSFANTDHQIVFAMAPEGGLDLAEMQKQSNPFSQPQAGVDQTVNGMFMGMSVQSGIDFEIGIDCKSSSQASDTVTRSNAEFTQAKQMLPAVMGGVPAQYKDIVQSTVDSISITSSGNLLTVKASIPSGISDIVAEAVQNLGNLGNILPNIPGLPNFGGGGPPGGGPGVPGSGGFQP